jgi:plasmid stabilization system protein ParE
VKFAFHPEALAEFEAAALHYATIQPELAQRFVASNESAVGRLTDGPLNYSILEQDVRRCLARVFPYAVLYTIEPDYVLIVAVMHCHREPGYWKHRMASRP